MRFLYLLCAVILFPCTVWSGNESDEELLRDYISVGAVVRYEEPIFFYLDGKGALEGYTYVDSVAEELRRIIPELSIRRTDSERKANLHIYLADTEEEWRETINRRLGGSVNWQAEGPYIRGLTKPQRVTSGGEIKLNDVILYLDFQNSGGQKLWVVRHELMHALGVFGHPENRPDSVLNSMQREENKNGVFSETDKRVLRALYSSKRKTGERF